MSEHDAHRALTDTARMRMLPDPLEDTQRMTIISRRMRRDEALKLWPMSPKVKP